MKKNKPRNVLPLISNLIMEKEMIFVTNQSMIDIVRDKISDFRGSEEMMQTLNSVPDDFIYLYGPFISMTKGFESIADEIATYNPIMKVMVYGAFLIRKIKNGISYRDAKNLIKEFIIKVEDDIDNKDLHDALIKFATDYLRVIRDEQSQNKNLESFMTCASPIVPYQGTMERNDLMESEAEESIRVDICKMVDECITANENNLKAYLFKSICNDLAGILTNCSIVPTVVEKGTIIYENLDELLFKRSDVPENIRCYYLIAIIQYYNIPIKILTKKLNFFNELGDFKKMQSTAIFESLIDKYSSFTSIPPIGSVTLESVIDDPTLSENAENAINQILDNHKGYQEIREKQAEDNAKYDIDRLRSFISINRYIVFEEYPIRLFISTLEKEDILNISYMDTNEQWMEMTNDCIVVPFMDARDMRPKIIVMKAYSNDIVIYDNYAGMF